MCQYKDLWDVMREKVIPSKQGELFGVVMCQYKDCGNERETPMASHRCCLEW